MCINSHLKTFGNHRSCLQHHRKMSEDVKDWRSLAETKPLVGVAQMCSTHDKENNFKQLASLVEKAHQRGAKVLYAL